MTPEVKSRKAAAIQQRITTAKAEIKVLESSLVDLRQMMVLAKRINWSKK